MAYQVDGGGDAAAAAAAAARAKAAEEARRRAAEEAARKAAEEAARKAAEEAARKAAEAAREKAQDVSAAKGEGRYAAYGAPEEAPAPEPAKPVAASSTEAEAKPAAAKPAAEEPKQEGIAGIFNKIKGIFGFGSSEAPKPAAPKPEAPKPEAPKPAAAAAEAKPAEPEQPALPEAIQEEVALAKEQALEQKADRKERMAPPSAEVRAERAKEPIAAEHQAVFNTLEPQQQQAFRELTPQSRGQFNKVYEAVGGMWAEQTPYAKEASHGLRKMLQEGRLEVKDTTGETLIGTLAKRVDQDVQPAMQAHASGVGAIQSAIKQVAYPDRVFQGENTNTCASTALQGILANEDPAEFMRIATGLAFDGQVELQSGATVKLDASQVGTVDGNRSALSQAVQTSFDTFAKQFPAQGEDFGGGRVGGGGRYGGGRVGGTDRFGGGRVGGGGRIGEGQAATAAAKSVAEGAAAVGGRNGGQVDGGGLTQNQIEKLYENVVGRLAINTSVDDTNRFSTMDGVAAAVGAGLKVPVGVQGVDDQGNATHHMISVLGIRQDPKDPGNDQVVFTDPGTGRQAALPVKDFAQIMEAAIIPAQFADHMRWNVESKAADPFGGGRVGGGGRLG